MLKLAVLGCGRIGKLHAENLARHPRLHLEAVYDLDAATARAVADRLGCRAAGSLEEILGDAGIDAVVIATPTSTHADMIETVAAAGKPLFCEKPIDLDPARVDQCAAAIARYGVPIQIGFNRRFDRGHRAARDAVRAGEIGDLHQVIITSRDPLIPPKDHLKLAGGLLRDMTTHDFDLARFMLDDEPVEVFAVAAALVDPSLGPELGDHDTAMMILRTADGKMCHINNSRTSAYGYDQRVELLGRKGMILSDNRRENEVRRFGPAGTEVASQYLHFFTERYREAFVAELESFAESVESGRPCEVGFEDGRRALLLAQAAYRSLAERRLVRVSEVE